MRILNLLLISLACILPIVVRAVWISHNDFYGKPESKMYQSFLFPLLACAVVSTVAAFYYIIKDERLKRSSKRTEVSMNGCWKQA
jgi:hypothetical protein